MPKSLFWFVSLDVCNNLQNKPVAQIPQCTTPISHNGPFCNTNVHVCGHFCYKMVHCGYLCNALWDLWDVSIMLEWLEDKQLTHWGRVMHICVGNLTIFGSDNGLLPGRCQAIIWTNAGVLVIGPLGTNFSEISIEICAFSRKCI